MRINGYFQLTTQNGKSTKFNAPLISEVGADTEAEQEYRRKLNNALKRITGHRGSIGGHATESDSNTIGVYGDPNKEEGGIFPCGKFEVIQIKQ